MNDASSPSSARLAPQSAQNDLKSDVYEEFLDSLDILYIKGNLSGRLKFLESWPKAGELLFGQELISFDHVGTSDTERRDVLEDEAEERRLELLEIVKTLEEKSVEKSALQLEYVEPLIKKLGRDIAVLLYSTNIVDRFIPLPADAEPAPEQKDNDVKGDALKSDQDDIAALANEIAPEAAAQGAPSASNPIVDEPEPPAQPIQEAVGKSDAHAPAAKAEIPDPFAGEQPDVKKPVVPELDDNMDAVEPISVEPPPQRPVPDDIQQEATQQNPVLDSPPPSKPDEPENVFLGRSPYDREDDLPPPPPPPQPEQQPSPPSSDPAQQDITKPSAHKALDGMEPVASQKMTFMPAQKPDQEKASIPVIGDKDKPQDEGL